LGRAHRLRHLLRHVRHQPFDQPQGDDGLRAIEKPPGARPCGRGYGHHDAGGFWTQADAMAKKNDLAHFFKNLTIASGALLYIVMLHHAGM
jgi:hypothetical protein